MLSRVANSIYWMNRYIERAENYARFIDVNRTLTLELPPGYREQWKPMVMVTEDTDIFESKNTSYKKEVVIRFLATDVENENSIMSCISKARENANTIRDVITSEMWFLINELYHSVHKWISEKDWNDKNSNAFLKEIINGSRLFCGIMDTTFSHTEAWHFGYMGRMLERTDKISKVVDMKYYYLLPAPDYIGTSLDLLHWSALLKSASAFGTYRKKYHDINASNIIDFLILDNDFPRAVKYCITRAERSLHIITGTPANFYSCKAERKIGMLKSELDYIEVSEVIKIGLHDYLNKIESEIKKTSSAISESFF